jgi:hypothetical protein
MGRAITAYLIIQKALQKRNIVRRGVIEWLDRLFATLDVDQLQRLERGVNLSEDELQVLAASLGEEHSLVADEIENFLYWLQRSPQFREREVQ